MLANYRNPPPGDKNVIKAMQQQAAAARKTAAEQPEPITEAELLACIEQYNATEAAAHELRRLIFAALMTRKGYKMLRVGADTFNGTEAALNATAHSDPPRLIVVESLGSE